MTGTEQLDKILFPITKIVGSVSIADTLRTGTANCTDPTIQPTIFHPKQATRLGRSDRNHFPIGSLNSVIDVPRSGQNIDNHTRMNPQVTIVTMIPESFIANNYDIFGQ